MERKQKDRTEEEEVQEQRLPRRKRDSEKKGDGAGVI